ncbi:MAG TPA: hypothetical protein VFW52_00100 [Candidatus Saccharimonadales bacterium]|nr:hypothetical protein [Candidatus Saccharimonadales bacterium]
MSEKFFVQLSEAEYREGINQRLYPEEIEADAWYWMRETCDDAKKLGSYAVEALTCVKYVNASKEQSELQLQLLDADGQPLGEEVTATLLESGIIYDPADLSSEGYLIGYEDYADTSIDGVVERIMAHVKSPYEPLKLW